ncbi:aminopeptidase [Paenibacillus thalictri]|uniref:Aminopeptidase n=1 Tax=Paenibacillus thalictri TaxID=2527873 RepID=A0A4Q9DXY9_9BACL|nr:aminopeptidase [Paenibacillus thalictri]TBL81266.1 aminopeptidase [Paenibacillus thalictri]
MNSFQQQLEKYAELAVKVGVNVQKGQQLAVTAPLETAPLVRLIAAQAYAAGAKYVYVDWEDDELRRTYMLHAPEDTLEQYPLPWRAKGYMDMADENAAFLTVYAPNPDLLKDADPSRVAAASKAAMTAMHGLRTAKQNSRVSWSIVCAATKPWAAKVFADLQPDEAVEQLWEHIFRATRIDQDDPVSAWQTHLRALTEKTETLNRKKYKKLHYSGPGTNLSIALPDRHLWAAAGMNNAQGTFFVPNMPTEEVFTLPDKYGINGTVSSTKPLNYNGSLIDGFSLTFENGKVTGFTAQEGYETLKRLIETDEGSAYLGEVAIVPHDSPISRMDRIFFNTAYDENASSHLAIGSAYPFCLEGGVQMNPEELAKHGVNRSLTHVDFMIGSSELDIDGETADGTREPLVRQGNWV